MALDWYYWGDGDQIGPVSLADLTDLARAGQLGPSTDVRRTSEIGWTPAGQSLPHLFQAPGADGRVGAAPGSSWTDRQPHPWRRFLARRLDTLVIGLLMWALIGAAGYSIAPVETDLLLKRVLSGPLAGLADTMLTTVIAIPAMVLMTAYTGLTPGKWVFGVRVLRKGAPMGLSAAIRREIQVWAMGLAFGIPLIALFTMGAAFTQLKDRKKTQWDDVLGLEVVHRPKGLGATLLMWAGGIGAAALQAYLLLPKT